jgi:SnoaL-like protein
MVEELQDRQAIHDCVLRYCRGGDRLDREVMLSAYHPDAIEEHGKFVGSATEFVDFALKQHADAHLTHQHYVMNHRCDLDSDVAHTETYFMFVAMNKHGKPLQMNGGRYVDRFERRDGKWAIACRVCLRDWAMMDERPDMNDLTSFTSTRALLSPEVRAFMNGGPASRRDRTDPSYQRPLRVDPERVRACQRMKSGS